jgi:ribosome-associated protein
MNDPTRVQVNRRFSLPRSELRFRTSRSGGPGGQHVNTSATRVQLSWNVAGSRALSDHRRSIIMGRLGSRIDQDGNLRITVDTHRSQYRNREEAVERLVALLADALRPRKTRKPTRPPTSSRERRLEQKKHRSALKQLRGRIPEE